MLYIILIIIAIFVYLIYKGQNPKITSKEDMQIEIERKEVKLLEFIQTNHLKDYMDTEKALFECGRINFIRLRERFKHDEIKLEQVFKDWIDYMDTLNDAIYKSLQIDVTFDDEFDTLWKDRNELYIKIQEINKRFKDLLGNEYANPEKDMTSREEKLKQLVERSKKVNKKN
jgi:methyl-accepting chemotaxis protein